MKRSSANGRFVVFLRILAFTAVAAVIAAIVFACQMYDYSQKLDFMQQSIPVKLKSESGAGKKRRGTG